MKRSRDTVFKMKESPRTSAKPRPGEPLPIGAAPEDIAAARARNLMEEIKRKKTYQPAPTIADIEAEHNVKIIIQPMRLHELPDFLSPDQQMIGEVGKYDYTKQAILKHGHDVGGHEYLVPQIKTQDGRPWREGELVTIMTKAHKIVMAAQFCDNKRDMMVMPKWLGERTPIPPKTSANPLSTEGILGMIMQKKDKKVEIPTTPRQLPALKRGAYCKAKREGTRVERWTWEIPRVEEPPQPPYTYKFKSRYADRIDSPVAWWDGKEPTDLRTYLDFLQANRLLVQCGAHEMWDPAYIKTVEEAEDLWHARMHIKEQDPEVWQGIVLHQLKTINEERSKNSLLLHKFQNHDFYFFLLKETPMLVPYEAGLFPVLQKRVVAPFRDHRYLGVELVSEDQKIHGRKVLMMPKLNVFLPPMSDARPHLEIMNQAAAGKMEP